LFGRCGSLDLSHPYGPSRPVTGIALLFFTLLTDTLGIQTHNRMQKIKIIKKKLIESRLADLFLHIVVGKESYGALTHWKELPQS
jgi:hypothetical protein